MKSKLLFLLGFLIIGCTEKSKVDCNKEAIQVRKDWRECKGNDILLCAGDREYFAQLFYYSCRKWTE